MITIKNILVIDDENEIRELLKIYLSNHGYNIIEASNGLDALTILSDNDIDLILVDIMMPKLDGIEFVKELRKDSVIPIIFISAKSDDMDKIFGLQIGADDYIAKPFNPLEVVSRVQSLLRRVEKYSSKTQMKIDDIIEIGDLKLDLTSCELYKGGEIKELTSYEYKILSMFMKNPSRVYTKAQIYENAWGEDYIGDENIIMVYVSKIREKIEDNPKKPKYLKTIRGLGYRFEKYEKVT